MLRASELYTRFSGDRLPHFTDAIVDDCCGFYPVYWTITDEGRLYVSRSVMDLVSLRGVHYPNHGWRPFPNSKRIWGKHEDLIKRGTGDAYVHRLPAHFRTTAQGMEYDRPEPEDTTLETFLDEAARAMQTWVEAQERLHPERANIVLTGGFDSRILLLIPKRCPSNWYALSVGPRAHLVGAWLESVDVDVPIRDWRSAPRSEEHVDRIADACDCLWRTPLMSGGWPCALIRAAADWSLGQNVAVWTGLGGSEIYRGTKPNLFARKKWRHWYARMELRMPVVQGSVVQAITNYTGWPVFSPYHNPRIWQDVYRRYHPRAIGKHDQRRELARRFVGPVKLGSNVQHKERWPEPKAKILARYRDRLAASALRQYAPCYGPGVQLEEAQ